MTARTLWEFSTFRLLAHKEATRLITNHPGRCAASPPLEGGEWAHSPPFKGLSKEGWRSAAGVASNFMSARRALLPSSRAQDCRLNDGHWRTLAESSTRNRSTEVARAVGRDLVRLHIAVDDHAEPGKHHFLRGHFTPHRNLVGPRIEWIVRGIIMVRRDDHPGPFGHLDRFCDFVAKLPVEVEL